MEHGTAEEDLWKDVAVPTQKQVPAPVLVRKTGVSLAYVKKLRNGHRNLSSDTQMILLDLALRHRE